MEVTKTQNATSKAALLDTMVKTIVEIVAPEKIILFGSQARGAERVDSDYDLLIVASEPFGETGSRRKEAGRLGWALSKLDVVTDILIYSPEEVRQRCHWRSGIIAEALREGKVLYERA